MTTQNRPINLAPFPIEYKGKLGGAGVGNTGGSSGTGGGTGDETGQEARKNKSFVDKALTWLNIGLENTEAYRNNIIDNYKFVSNDQWPDADKAQLEAQHRPALVINRSTSIILTVSGLQRRSRQEIKLLPFEPDDAEAAELMQVLLKWTRDRNKAKQIDADVFLDKIMSGMGFWKLSYDFLHRPQGDIKVEKVSPLSVIWDPNWPDVPWDQAEWVIHSEWRTLEAAIAEWPEFEDEIRTRFGQWSNKDGELLGDSNASRRNSWDAPTQRLRLAQLWYKELTEVDVAVFADGEVIWDQEEVDAIRAVIPDLDGELKDSVTIIKRPVPLVRVAHLLDDILLNNIETPLPFQELPIRPALGYYFWKQPFGLVDLMKDPQREKNKRRSAITELAGRTAHSGWLNKKGTGADPGDLEKYASGNGVVIEYEQDEPRAIKPPELPQVLIMLEAQADKEIKEVVNVNDELLGQTDAQTVSGRAIEARQRGGLITQEPLFDSFQDEQADLARLIIEMIKDNVTEEEALRVLGTLAARDQDDMAAQSFAAEDPSVVRELLSRSFATRYDVVITNKPFDPSHKVSVFNALLEMKRNIPELPADIVIQGAVDAGVMDKAAGLKAIAALSAPPPEAMDPMGGMDPMAAMQPQA